MSKSYISMFVLIVLVKSTHNLDNVSEELDKKINDKIDKENENFDDSERRFMDNLNDQEWHVAHLKPTDFENTRRVGSDCKEETFDEIVKRYRNSLKEDPGRIKFVYANPLLVNEEDLKQQTCIPTDKDDDSQNVKNEKITTKKSITTTKGYNPMVTEKSLNRPDTTKAIKIDAGTKTVENEDSKKSETTITNTDSVKTTKREKVEDSTLSEATVETEDLITPDPGEGANIVPILTTDPTNYAGTKGNAKKPGNKADKEARRGDYMFSSVEYDDNVGDFTADTCPGVVDIITLELQLLRPYDVECEKTLQWQSLLDN